MPPKYIQDRIAANVARSAGLSVAPITVQRANESAAAAGQVPYLSTGTPAPAPQVQQPAVDTAAIAAARAAAADRAAKQAAANPLFESLKTLDTIRSNKDQGSRDEFGRAIAGYDEQDALDRTNYSTNVAQNETTYTGNNQKALLNAANASTGLRGVLSSMRALGGSGIDIVKRLVGLAANSDTGASRDTFETNATNLNQSFNQAERESRQRRKDAEALLENNLKNNESTVLTTRQGILQQLANTFGAGTAEGAKYAAEAGALAAPIAATTRATIAPYQAASSLYTPAALKTYLAGTQNLDVSTTAGSQPVINSPLFGTEKKDKLSGVA